MQSSKPRTPGMSVDYYGNEFDRTTIVNRDRIGFVDFKELKEFTEDEISSSTILISDEKELNKLYLLSDLKAILAANRYARVEDPLTREDLVEKLPEFKKMVTEFEDQAANYNASVLEKYPHFVGLLKIYVEEILHPRDSHRYRDAKIGDIEANKSGRLDSEFYAKIRDFSEDEAAAFHSLFITNREYFREGNLMEFPTKWTRTLNNQWDYDECTRGNPPPYTPFPHRNVFVGDAFENPDNACMHSWGMDILYLLQQYHIGMNKPFQVFENFGLNSLSYEMEQALCKRIQQETPRGSLDPAKGATARKALEIFAIGDKELLAELIVECQVYMTHLLKKLGIENPQNFVPLEGVPTGNDANRNALINKYVAVRNMYVQLVDKNNNPDQCIENFRKLYQEDARRDIIQSHRDGKGVRFLNAVASLLTVGIKNLITYFATGRRYWGFLESKGESFSKDVDSRLKKHFKR